MAAKATDLLEAANSIAPLVRSLRDETEKLGRTPPAAVEAIANAGLFRLWLPASLDGFEADPRTFYGVIEEVSAADGATGWNVMNGACCGLMSVYLRKDVGREIYVRPGSVVAGQIAPNGKAVATKGGYRLSGRWSFGSGIHHATTVVSGCTVFDGDAPRLNAAGAPVRMHVMTPPSDVQIDFDSWNVSGLRGTGSCDYTIEDVFVPEEHTFAFFVSQTFHSGPLAFLPRTMFSLSITPVTIGIARAAIEAFIELASTKKAAGSSSFLRDQPAAQLAVARAEGLVGAARAFMREASEEVWRACVAGHEPSLAERVRLREASVIGPQLCAEAVDTIWKAGGAGSIREPGLIERCFRDVHVATQHIGAGEAMLTDAGRTLLGLDAQVVPF